MNSKCIEDILNWFRFVFSVLWRALNISVTIFGIAVVVTWFIGHYVCQKYQLDLDKVGDALLGVAGVLGVYVGINKYFDSKSEKTIRENRGKLVGLLVQMRSFVEAMYLITSPFGRNQDPAKNEDDNHAEYMMKVRESRTVEYENVIKDFLNYAKEVDAYFNKEIIELYFSIYEKWRSLNVDFRMWYMTFDNRRVDSKNGEYWNNSQLSKEDYDNLMKQIDEIIKIINPNYNKELSEIEFD